MISTRTPTHAKGYAEYKRGDLQVRIDSMYEASAEAAGTCLIQTSIQLRGKPPASRTVELTPAMLERQLSIGLKHHSLDGVNLPGTSVSIGFDCRYEHRDAQFHCEPSGSQTLDPALIEAAQNRIAGIRLDDTLAEPDNPVPLRTTLTIVLASADRRPLDFVKSPRASVREIEWTDYPSGADVEAYGSSGSGVVPVACQIQPDASLICAAFDASNQAIAPVTGTATQRAAVEILRRYVPAPTLKSGSPAAGTVFATTVDFRSR